MTVSFYIGGSQEAAPGGSHLSKCLNSMKKGGREPGRYLGKSPANRGNSRHSESDVGLHWFVLGTVRRPGWIKHLKEERENPKERSQGLRLYRAL